MSHPDKVSLLLQTIDSFQQTPRSKADEPSRERLLAALSRIKLCVCFIRIDFAYLALKVWYEGSHGMAVKLWTEMVHLNGFEFILHV